MRRVHSVGCFIFVHIDWKEHIDHVTTDAPAPIDLRGDPPILRMVTADLY